MQRPRGFTLIELMVVIAIIGILTTLAVPTYQERVVRAQVGEALALADLARDSINATWKQAKRMPKTNADAGLPPADRIIGNYVTRVEVVDGAIHVTLGHRINRLAAGKVLTLRPAAVPGWAQVPLAWNCGNANAPEGMQVYGENRTTLLPAFLPIDCRG